MNQVQRKPPLLNPSSAAECLIELAQQVRGLTVRLLQTAEEEALLWTPPGLHNHIIWRSGHALWLQDLMCIAAITGAGELPPGWAETFGQHCRPVQQTRTWPTRNDLLMRLEQQSDRMCALLRETSDTTLAGPAHGLGRNRTLAGWIIHGLHDEALHHGESYLILKIFRAKAP